MTAPQQLVQKLWNYCNILRDDGLSYGDYVEQLTFLLFLKMAEEQAQFRGKASSVPKGYDWPSLLAKDGDELEAHYRHVLDTLGKKPGMLGLIFRKAQNKIQDPAKLRRLIVDLIDKEQWTSLSADVKGDAYEGLLQKNAEDVKGGAGQYFTPRALIAAMVECVAPRPGETICDPACGTGGFLLAAHDFLAKSPVLDRAQKKKLKAGTFYGIELVDSVTRLCAMNLLLHGIGDSGSGILPLSDEEAKRQDAASTLDLPVVTKDALAGKHGEYEIVLANPPFGKKSSVTIVNEAGESSKESLIINRDDFWATTSNKQLNFLQHIFTILKQHGRAAVVLPDNVLFEGGAGETIRRELLKQADVHTLLRLPTGIFYAQGVKANVLFFDRKPAQEKPWTQKLWIYDLRTNLHFTLKENTLKRSDLDDFVKSYNPKNRHERKATERFKAFGYDELTKRDKANLDIFWLKDDALEESANLPAPEVIAADIAADLEAALEQFNTIAEDLK
ncbi:MAG: class I SAM-dependent DNA methyltransferase [Kiritimatiellae bacterium]|nr:class I SAM-dependent DNA methyltransferase [Kiritimatiellia bacterium]MDD4024993.1 class I SAM-dependent DNA methyltransferase [Kiritimatiellia bacterium]